MFFHKPKPTQKQKDTRAKIRGTPKILVIDTDPTAKLVLEGCLFEVETASNELTALEVLGRFDPNVIILSISLFKSSWSSFYEKLQALAHNPEIVVISSTTDAKMFTHNLFSDIITTNIGKEGCFLCIEQGDNKQVSYGNSHLTTLGEIFPLICQIIQLLSIDKDTTQHSIRVATYARIIGKDMRLNDKQLSQLHVAALLHDLGKVGVGREILLKTSRLSPQEFKTVMQHPEIAASIIQRLPFDHVITDAVMHHHERFDGTGYPHKIGGSDLSLFTRIITAADAFDAMTSNRPYKNGLPPEQALREIMRCSGTQFCPEVSLCVLDNQGKFNSILSLA